MGDTHMRNSITRLQLRECGATFHTQYVQYGTRSLLSYCRVFRIQEWSSFHDLPIRHLFAWMESRHCGKTTDDQLETESADKNGRAHRVKSKYTVSR